MNVLSYAKEHPYIIGGGVFALGLLWLLSRGSGGSSSTDAGLASAYYGAIAADKQAATQQIVAQTNANAAVTINQAQADAYTHVQDTWAETSLGQAQINADAATSLAPYALSAQYIGALTDIASQPGTVTTKSSSGFFGIGGGTKQVYTPNPNAAAATDLLSHFNLNGYLPAH